MKWRLDAETSALLHTMTGSDDAEEATPVTLFVGESRDDDGKLVHGLHAYESEYPEEGCTPLVEFPKQTEPVAQFHEAVISIIGDLMNGDPAQDSAEGRLLVKLADAVEAYEKAVFPMPADGSATDGVRASVQTKVDRFLDMARVWVERDGGNMDEALAWMYRDTAGVALPAMPKTQGGVMVRKQSLGDGWKVTALYATETDAMTAAAALKLPGTLPCGVSVPRHNTFSEHTPMDKEKPNGK
jgi:hypothetical protein